MIVRHVPIQSDPALCSATQKSWVYRTEVENDAGVPIRVIWFEFSYRDDAHGGGSWFSTNVRNRPLRSADFVEWYGDGDGDSKPDGEGWLAPGAVAACDPNYSWAFTEEITPVTWAFIAVDAEGKDYFAEAVVPSEAASLYEPEGAEG